jgi:hypothetical protein
MVRVDGEAGVTVLVSMREHGFTAVMIWFLNLACSSGAGEVKELKRA